MPRIVPLLALFLLAPIGCSEEPPPSPADQQDLLEIGPIFPEPAGTSTRYPIVLAHGFNSSKKGYENVAEALRKDGHSVHVSEVAPFDTVMVRAPQLAKHIDATLAEFGAQKVNLIAHSMGGLDARELVSKLGYGDRVATITTIGTPHRGSGFADEALDQLGNLSDEVLDGLASAFGVQENELAANTHLRVTVVQLAEGKADEFEAAHPDDPRVFYQSWAGVSGPAAVPNPQDFEACDRHLYRYAFRTDYMAAGFIPLYPLVSHGSDCLPSDGLVTVESAHHGEFRGCVPADHLDLTGKRSTQMDTHTGYSPITFYRTIAFDLSDMGF